MRTLRAKLLLTFVLNVLLPAIAITAILSVISLRQGRQQAIDRLDLVAAVKQNKIDSWLRELQSGLDTLLLQNDVVRRLQGVLDDSAQVVPFLQAQTRDRLAQSLQAFSEGSGYFDEIFVIDTDGREVLSTGGEPGDRSHGDAAYFREGLRGFHVQPPYYAPSLERTILTVARPVRDDDGGVTGVVAARADLTGLGEIIRERTGLSGSGETYLLSDDAVSLIESARAPQGAEIRTEGALRAVASKADGFSLYENHRGTAVVGAYHWLPELRAALVSEVAQAEAFRSTYLGLLTAAGIAGVAVLLAIAAGLLIIRRTVTGPIARLSAGMLAVAGGNLRVPLPEPRGSDEIAEMTRALTVFRDTAVEIEDNNLREIAQARRRLVDALESTSEGFAFFDPDDRLVLSNSRFKELLHQGHEGTIKPGMTFEDIIRQAVADGLVADAAGDPEGWVARRLAQHRRPGPPQLQRRGDDRWIQVSERRTEEGGVVAVYSDLTELKENEQKAANAHRLIMESLRYASRIQTAILPARDALSRATRDHFLIWEPRDVVGGDFFWLHRTNRGAFIIVGDCTGHGVPGAFMTLIACGLLDRHLRTLEEPSPAALLGALHHDLRAMLGQDRARDGETDDGLEAGVCFVDAGARRLVYAGARFSLWRARGATVSRIKGDRPGIGHRRSAADAAFTDVALDLTDGEAFYLTTDGLIDQIGGARRRSFGSKRFAAFIAEHRARPMAEQGAALTAALARHQGDEDRRDDVTVLGFAPLAA